MKNTLPPKESTIGTKARYLNFSHNSTKARLHKERKKIIEELSKSLDEKDFIKKHLRRRYRLRGYTLKIIFILLRNEEGLPFKIIANWLEKKFGVPYDDTSKYVQRLKKYGLVENENGKWKLTIGLRMLYEKAKDKFNGFNFGPFDDRIDIYLNESLRKELIELKEKEEALKLRRIEKAIESKEGIIKITYCLASRNRKYKVKQNAQDLKERLEKVYKDLAERFPERGYELKVLKKVASDLYIVRENQKPYEIIFRDNKGLVEVYVKFSEFKTKATYYLWLLRTLLYKLKILEKVEKKNEKG
jgi:hypothetical protein